MTEITQNQPNKKPSKEQIFLRRGMLAVGIGASALVAVNNGNILRNLREVPGRFTGIGIPKPSEATKVRIGDEIKFKNQDGKIVIERVGQISDLTNAVAQADPNLLSNDVSAMLTHENHNSALVHGGDEFLLPNNWGITDIEP